MPHTYSSCFIHAVFSTKRRQRILSSTTRERLWPFLEATARKNGFRVIAANGWDDHVHLLIKIPSTIAAAKAIQILKKRTSAFMGKPSAWQEGYAAVTLSAAEVEETSVYLERQSELHAAKTFEEEYISFLKKHRIRFDVRYVFD
jgi:putative transposase